MIRWKQFLTSPQKLFSDYKYNLKVTAVVMWRGTDDSAIKEVKHLLQGKNILIECFQVR